MDAREYIQRQVSAAHNLCDAVMRDITEDQFNWTAPGTANPISSTFVHIVAGEDMFIQAVLQGKPRLWDAEGWADRVGIAATPGRGQGWDEIRAKRVKVAPLLDYQQAVRAATDTYLATLNAEQLDQKVTFAGRERGVAEVLTMLVTHVTSHSGEIAALKGIQGGKGLPF